MAVTTTYLLTTIGAIDLEYATDSADVVSLGNGGFAGLGNHAAHIDGTIFSNVNGIASGAWLSNPGTNGSIAQLSNGNFVIASSDVDSTVFQVMNRAGDTIVVSTDIGDTNSFATDVAGLKGGGFVIVGQEDFGGGDFDIDVNIRSNTGAPVTSFTIATGLENDQDACVAGLDNGNFAVAWTRTVGANTQVWYAVYDALGNVVKAAAVYDDVGTLADNVSISATNTGFAIVYEQNRDGQVDITYGALNFEGAGIFYTDITDDLIENSNASITRISNGLMAVSYSRLIGDNDIVVQLIDPTNGTVLATRVVTGGESITDETNFSTLAGFGYGRIAAFWTNSTDGDVDGDQIQITRTSTSDAASDLIQGDQLADIMIGNDGNDTLYGGYGDDTMIGGIGNDVMSGQRGADVAEGGQGNDIYYVNSASDVTTEFADEGTDTVYSVVNRTLSANIENLVLQDGAINGSGNAENNRIVGNAAANTLKGLNGNDTLDGGGGADTMEGGAGDDTYVVNNAGVTTTEAFGKGTDTVRASVDHTLQYSVENLVMLGTAVNGTGNSGANIITGNASANNIAGFGGDDTISGGNGNDTINGGAGNDRLTGGAGNDRFVFNQALTGANSDVITDMTVSDSIYLENAVFTGLADGVLAVGAFAIGAAATEADDRIIYNSATGALYFDVDGVGGTAQVQFATVSTGLALTNADFIVT